MITRLLTICIEHPRPGQYRKMRTEIRFKNKTLETRKQTPCNHTNIYFGFPLKSCVARDATNKDALVISYIPYHTTFFRYNLFSTNLVKTTTTPQTKSYTNGEHLSNDRTKLIITSVSPNVLFGHKLKTGFQGWSRKYSIWCNSFINYDHTHDFPHVMLSSLFSPISRILLNKQIMQGLIKATLFAMYHLGK